MIDKTLIPAKADWNIRFATNQMVLCFTEKSRHADQINADNWFEILQKKNVVWGHSDPNLDPAGYRSLMVLQLAETFYRQPGLYKQAQVKVTGKQPGEWITRTGQSVTYGITLIKDAPNPAGAVRFLEYLLSADGGLTVLKAMGQPPFIPCRVTSQVVRDALPGNLPNLVEVRE